MTSRALLLTRAAKRIADRLLELDQALEAGDRSAWREYVSLTATLAVLGFATSPEHGGPLLTTREMAERLGIKPKTLLRRRKRGEVRAPVKLGERGRAALRRRGTEAG